MQHQLQNRYDELYRIVELVAKARYTAHRRLTFHSSFAQFSLTFLSIGLIIIPLLDLGGFSAHYSPKYIQIMQIVFAVILLAYSLLLSMGRFEARAEKMLSCGIALSRILRQVKPLQGTSPPLPDPVYDELYTRYYDILEKFENHTQADYHSVSTTLLARQGIPVRGQQTRPEYVGQVMSYFWKITTRRAGVYFMWTIVYSHYFISVIAMYAWIFYMVYPSPVTR